MMLTKSYLKAYALFGKDKVTGVLYGYVEHSFSMGLSQTDVRRWPIQAYDVKLNKELTFRDLSEQKKYQERLLANLERDRKSLSDKYPQLEFFIVRLNSKNCPVIIDWKAFHKAEGKYDRRNVKWRKK